MLWIRFCLNCANKDNEKTTSAGEKAQFLFTTHAFIYKIEDILIDEKHSIQWLSRNVWTTRPPVTTVLIARSSRQAGAKLYRKLSHDLCVDSSRLFFSKSKVIKRKFKPYDTQFYVVRFIKILDALNIKISVSLLNKR